MVLEQKHLRFAIGAALCGAIGFAIARLAPHLENRAVPGTTSALPESAQPAATGGFDEPPRRAASAPDFKTAAGFHTYVKQLQDETGVDEEFAQWLALTAFAKENFDGAFQIARAEKLLGLWATGAAALDPASAVASMKTLTAQESRMALAELLTALGRIDPKSGLALLETLPAGTTGYFATFSFFQNWADVSLDAAAKSAARMQRQRVRDGALAGVFHVWGLEDRQGMMEWAATQDVSVGKTAFRSFYESAGVRDPEEVLEIAQDFPKTVEWNILAEISSALAAKGASGWEAIFQLPAGPLRNEVMLRAGSDMASTDPQGAWKLFQTLEPADRPYFLRLSAGSLAKVAPREMAEMFASGGLGSEYLSSIMEAWAQSDAPAALAWSSANFGGRTKANALNNVFREWTKKDAASATGALESLAPGERARLLPVVAQEWASADPASAFAWAQSRSAVDRTRAIEAVVKGWSASDPVAAAKVLLETPPAGLESSYDTVSRNLAQKQPAYAVQWATNLSDTEIRNRAIGRVVNIWGRQDASAAADQLSEMKPGDFRDSAVNGFVHSIAELDPATAATWAGSIQTPEMRRSSLRSVLQSWRTKDRAAAAAFVNDLKPGPLKNEMAGLVGN